MLDSDIGNLNQTPEEDEEDEKGAQTPAPAQRQSLMSLDEPESTAEEAHTKVDCTTQRQDLGVAQVTDPDTSPPLAPGHQVPGAYQKRKRGRPRKNEVDIQNAGLIRKRDGFWRKTGFRRGLDQSKTELNLRLNPSSAQVQGNLGA